MKQIVLRIGSVGCSPSPKQLGLYFHRSLVFFWQEQFLFPEGTSRAALSYLVIVFSVFILCAAVNQMQREDAVRIRPHSKPLPWPERKYDSLAFLSSASASVCKLFLFSFIWPEFTPVHCKKQRSQANICRKRIKMEIPLKASGLERGTPARNQHRDCRSSLRVCSETVGCIPAIELLCLIS